MAMRTERGNIGVFLMISIVLGGAAGYGVYRVMREQRLASEKKEAEAKARQRAPSPPAIRDEPGVPRTPAPAEPVAEPEQPVDRSVEAAASRASAPEVPDSVDKDTVVFGSPGIVGLANSVGIDRVVRASMPRFARCMRKAREASRTPDGLLTLIFVIGVDGKVSEATAPSSPDLDASLTPCTLDVIRALRFDRPTDGKAATVVFPVAFVAPKPCDEVSCVLNDFAGPCCAKFKKREEP